MSARQGWRWVGVVGAAAVAVGVSGCGLSVVQTSWSPDSKRIAYVGLDKLRVYEVATKESKDVPGAEKEAFAPSWSPEGKEIAFYQARPGGEKEPGADLAVLDIATGQVRVLVPSIWYIPPESEAKTTGADGLHDAGLDEGLALMVAATIQWSPDSRRLVCTSSTKTAAGAMLVTVGSGEVKPILQGRHTLLTLSWSPDGRRLAYLETPGLPTETQEEPKNGAEESATPIGSLWVYEVKTGTPSKVCDAVKGGWAVGTRLAWSADSGEIGFIVEDPANEGRTIGCIVASKEGAAAREEVRGLTGQAAWAPGLKGLAFMEERENDQVVLLYRGMKPAVRKVIGEFSRAPVTQEEATAEVSQPDFSPNGRKVAVLVSPRGEGEERVLVFDVP